MDDKAFSFIKKNNACLITERQSRRYFSKIDLSEGYLLLSSNPVYFTDARYFVMLKEKLLASNIKPVLFNDLSSIKEELKRQKIKNLFVDYEYTTVKEFCDYKSFRVKIKDFSTQNKLIRSIKSESEIADIKRACEITQKAFYKTLESVKSGITELELADKMRENIVLFGGEGESFETIVAFGKNSAIPHHETGNTKLKKDMPILIDTGAKYNGYLGDYTRTFYFGKPTEKFLSCYKAVLQANVKAEEEITCNMTARECDEIARSVLRQKNIEEYFTHSLGHGVGLMIHEFPYLSKRRQDKIVNGNVFTVEPGVYFEGEFGIRIEDTVALKNGKVERLYNDSKELIIIK